MREIPGTVTDRQTMIAAGLEDAPAGLPEIPYVYTLDGYQGHAEETAIFPRVWTEDQVAQLIGYLTVEIEELHSVNIADLWAAALEGLDRIETPFNRLVYPMLGLVGEAGEMANKLKKVARDKGGEMDLDALKDGEKELGDVMWYVAAVATGLRTTLGQVAARNIAKLRSRKDRGVLGGSGDNR